MHVRGAKGMVVALVAAACARDPAAAGGGVGLPPSGPAEGSSAPRTIDAGLRLIVGARSGWAVDSIHWLAWEGAGSDVAVEWSTDRVTWTRATREPPTRYERGTDLRMRWRVPAITEKTVALRLVVGDRASPAVDVSVLPSQRRAYAWQRKTAAAGFVWRDGAALAQIGQSLRLVGGWNPTLFRGPDDYVTTTSEIWTTSDGVKWGLASVAPWEPRHTFGHTSLGGRFFVIGGDALHAHYQPDVWSTADGDTWRNETSEAPWGNRVLHLAMSHENALWVFGGQTIPEQVDDRDPLVVYNDVWRSVDGRAWTRVLAQAPWPPRGAVDGNASFRGAMWLLGGGTYASQPGARKVFADTWSSRDGVTWVEHEAPPWVAREYHSVAVFDDRLWIVAGYAPLDGSDLDDVWYTADGENWYPEANPVWPARHAAAVVATADALWITAGSGGDTGVYALARAP